MKKLIAVCVALAMLLALSGCGSKAASSQPASEAASEVASEAPAQPETTPAPESEAQEEPVIGMANPMEAMESLDEVNQAVGCHLSHLGVMGVTDVMYNVYHIGEYDVGEYVFEFLGAEWTSRAARTENDISGVYVSGDVLSAFGEADTPFEEGGYYYTRWFDDDMQYSIACQHNDQISMEQFQSGVEELRAMQSVQ